MSFTYFGLVKAKSGISLEEFRDHYENVHVPLVLKFCPMLRDYRRTYLDHTRSALAAGFECPYDVIAEFRFDSEADYLAYSATIARPEIAKVIGADSALFIDTSTITRLMGEEVRSIK